MALTIGVDVGGTKVNGGVVDEDGTIVARTRRPTPGSSPAHVEDAIAAVVADLRVEHDVDAVGIGAAGFIDADRSRVLFAPNLSWRDEPLRDEVSARVGPAGRRRERRERRRLGGVPLRRGRAGEQHLVLVTVGTGIGGGIVLDGELYRGRFGIGAEFGHMQVVEGGRRCGCGQRGCWEQYCSGRALLHEAREIADVQPQWGARLLELGGGEPEGIEAPEVTRAARGGRPGGAGLLRGGRQLARPGPGQPRRGGRPGRSSSSAAGVSDAGDLLMAPARRAFAERLTGTGHRPLAQIRLAALGNDAGHGRRRRPRPPALMSRPLSPGRRRCPH